MNALGPFPMRAVLVAGAALAAWWLVRLLAVRFTASDDKTVPKLAGSLFADIFLVGLLAARIGYVLRWWPEYAAAPKSIIAIGDGGLNKRHERGKQRYGGNDKRRGSGCAG